MQYYILELFRKDGSRFELRVFDEQTTRIRLVQLG